LPGTARLTIGRSPRNDVALRWDGEVSRLHAEIVQIGDAWLLTDDQLSHNGTYVNGDRVRTRRMLRSGDVITAGDTQLAFVAPAADSVSATATAGELRIAADVTPAQRRVLVALCRPVLDGRPVASNREIAEALVIAVDTVKGALSQLFQRFGIGDDVPQNQKRALLARRALQTGVVRTEDLDQ
jgi:pSer/pThr/pTyr-binding forkhead associated (FHA) protein